jgi:hypothetical protein
MDSVRSGGGYEFAHGNGGLRLIRKPTAGLIHAWLAFPERLPGAIAQVKNEGEQQHRQDTQGESGADQPALPGAGG